MYKILVTPRSFASTSTKPLDLLEEKGYELDINDTGEKYNKEDMKEKIKDKDGVIVGTDPLGEDVLEKANRLKIISKYGVGLDNIDIKKAEEKKVTVTNTPGANSSSVAELAFAMMLGLARKIPEADRKCKKGFEGKMIGNTIWGKKLGIIGLGEIGLELAKRGNGFDMEVYYNDKKLLSATKEYDNKVSYRNIDEILRASDFISIHTPLTKETKNMITTKEMKKMKNSAFLINTSREKIINEPELFEALEKEEIAGAGLDEFECSPENIPENLQYKLILSPHMGAHTEEAIENMGVMSAKNLIHVLEDREISEKNLVC